MKFSGKFSLLTVGVLSGILLVSCAHSEKSKKDAGKKDRFAFLHKDSGKKVKSSAETAEQEKVSPKQEQKPLVSDELLDKLGINPQAAPKKEFSRTAGKFYDDFIALNGDEELEVSLVFNSAPLLDVLSAFADLLGFNFSADSDLKGVVTLNLNSKMTRRDLWNAFDRMLYLAGAGVKVDGSLIRVVALSKVAMQPEQRAGAEIYYKQLHNATAAEVVKQIRPYLGTGATCTELARPNAVLLCDSPENLEKLKQLLEFIDKSGKADWPRAIVSCNNVLPQKIANELQEVLPVLGLNIYKTTDRTVAPGAVQIVGINRMRLIVISAATMEAVNLVKEWVQLLDVAGSEDQENVFVYKVRHNKAAHLARALAVVFETQGTALTIDASTGKTKMETINSPVSRNTSRTTGRATSRSDVVNTGTNIQTDQDSKIYGATVRVFADGVLNRLVIRTTPRTYASLKALLDKLDVVPAQVLLQILMVEVTLTESTQFGLEFSGTSTGHNTKSIFGTNFSDANSGNALTPFITDAQGNTSLRTGSNRQSGGTIAITNPKNPQERFGYIRAKAGNGLVKVISSPQLLVSSHTEAKIQVGQSVPYITNGITDSSSSGSVTQSYDYRDTGVIMTVTPYVTSTDLISLDITQSMSQALSNTITPGINSPLFSTREIETSMTISNGQTMVLGGLIQEKAEDALDSLPIINQLPFLKRIFGSTNASVERTEVLVLITGYIVNEHSEIDALIKRYNDAVKAINSYENTLGDSPNADKKRGNLFQDKEFWK